MAMVWTDAPAGEQFYCVFRVDEGAKKSKSLKIARGGRGPSADDKSPDSASDNAKTEEPATILRTQYLIF